MNGFRSAAHALVRREVGRLGRCPRRPAISRSQLSGQSAASAPTKRRGRRHRGQGVGDDQVERPLPQQPQSLRPGPHRLHHVPLGREERAHHAVHRRVVIHHQDAPGYRGRPARLRLVRRQRPGASCAGRVTRNSAPPSGRRLVHQLAAVGLHQAVAQREAQPGALARALGGEERGEQMRDAGAAARRARCRAPGAPPSPSWRVVSSRDLARPARLQAAHRLHRVGDQVEQHLLQLVAVAQHDHRLGSERLLQLDAVELQLVHDEQRRCARRRR